LRSQTVTSNIRRGGLRPRPHTREEYWFTLGLSQERKLLAVAHSYTVGGAQPRRGPHHFRSTGHPDRTQALPKHSPLETLPVDSTPQPTHR
jgi:hypothetical protein